MPTVKFTRALTRFVPDLQPGEFAGKTVREILESLSQKHPKIRAYILDEKGALRKHVNIFLNQSPISDTQNLSDPVQPNDEIYIMQALSGG